MATVPSSGGYDTGRMLKTFFLRPFEDLADATLVAPTRKDAAKPGSVFTDEMPDDLPAG